MPSRADARRTAQQTARRAACLWAIALAPLLTACGDTSAPALTPEPRYTRAVRSADGNNIGGSWASVVKDHRITTIREVVGRVEHVRVRVYSYDSTGRLRDYSERAFAEPDHRVVVASGIADSVPMPVDSVMNVHPRRDYQRAVVMFRADMAVLMAGRKYSRRELVGILDRAARLYDLAIRGGSVVPRAPLRPAPTTPPGTSPSA